MAGSQIVVVVVVAVVLVAGAGARVVDVVLVLVVVDAIVGGLVVVVSARPGVVVVVVVVVTVVVGGLVVVVVGSQIVVVVDALGGIAAVGGVGVMPGGGAVGGVGLVVVDVVGDGWAAWRRTEAVRTTLPGLTVAHSSAQRRVLRPFPRFQAVVTRAHDVARARAPAQLPFPHAKVARRSPAHAVFSQALAMECPRSLPLRRAFAAVTVACSASAGAAMSPATSRAPTTTASQDARRRGHFMLRCSFARPNDSARWRLPPLPSGPVRLRDLLAGTLREQVPKLNLRRFLANSAESCSQSGSI